MEFDPRRQTRCLLSDIPGNVSYLALWTGTLHLSLKRYKLQSPPFIIHTYSGLRELRFSVQRELSVTERYIKCSLRAVAGNLNYIDFLEVTEATP